MTRSSGTIKFFDDVRGFGFVRLDDGGEDAFIHRTALAFRRAEGDDAPTLTEGQRVRFDLAANAKGPRALNVELDQQ
jgi:cold shock protein